MQFSQPSLGEFDDFGAELGADRVPRRGREAGVGHRLDLVVANDNEPNAVWLNNGTGTFTDSGLTLGSADLGLSVYNKHKIEKRVKDAMKEYDSILSDMKKVASDIRRDRDFAFKKLAEARATAKKEGYVVSPKELDRIRKELKTFK